MTLYIRAHGRPSPKGSLRHVGRGRLVEQVAGSKPWRQTVAAAAREAMAADEWTTTAAPVGVDVVIVVPHLKTRRRWPITRSSGDIDKHARNILDALVDAGVIADDSQVVALSIEKSYGDAPGAVVDVWEVER